MSREEWERLEGQARADERDPWQQARYLILRGLAAAGAGDAGDAEGSAPETADVA
jgi:hypothetical protein